ncbi:DnaD domain protein [Lentilactobacillus farraginis]|uniref:Helicase loader DnaB n=1 Tax=Lentilactobacillus farraginis DSM 18382 = JCM 14108 TaxID=1423743 RepID=X0PA34_9LACO|nr:DnaD domain protein [Lentilactobacillus farraginis]KRM04301.1 replicative DNA helicase DnaB [Lentilactobacillus farraginis DSM 18382 = JCM 14108]GAF35978.1 helicase loader DnaB [Lentilactobacillus farraginis DSM 18382 = JCM 14108]
MLNSENKLTPDSKYLILNASANKELDQAVLTNLYLPIIGRGAVSLYNLLWSMSVNDHNRLVLHKHFELQSILDVGVDKLLRYRRKLEAVNLLVTSVSLTSPDSYVYSLREPCTATEFLKTDVLSILLLSRVGEETYNRIVARLFIPTPDVGDVRDVSASLLDVFQIPENTIKNIPGPVNTAKRTINANQARIDSKEWLPDDDFDFNLLLDILRPAYVNLESVKAAYPLILSEHVLYGVDEIKMADFIRKATGLVNDKLNQKNLKLIISRSYTQPDIQKRAAAQATAGKSADQNQRKKLDVDSTTQEIIKISKTHAPIAFLRGIKDQKGGMVTSGEEWMIRELDSKNILPVEAINILSYYILIVLGHSSLIQNLFNTIADQWSQAHVASAEDAVLAIQNYEADKEKKQQERQKRASKYTGRSHRQIVEKLPEWAKKKKEQEKAASKAKKAAAEQSYEPDPEERKRVNEELAELRKRKERGRKL